jgi:hypothetical protein
MKKILIGIIAILFSFNGYADHNSNAVETIPSHSYAEDSDEGEESGEAADLNLINANTTGAITLDGGEDSGEGEESDEGEDSLGELPDDADTDNLEITVSDDS